MKFSESIFVKISRYIRFGEFYFVENVFCKLFNFCGPELHMIVDERSDNVPFFRRSEEPMGARKNSKSFVFFLTVFSSALVLCEANSSSILGAFKRSISGCRN